MQRLRTVVAYLRKRKGLSATEALAKAVLVTDGRDVFELEDGSFSFSTLSKPGQGSFYVVMLGKFVTQMQDEAREMRDGPATHPGPVTRHVEHLTQNRPSLH